MASDLDPASVLNDEGPCREDTHTHTPQLEYTSVQSNRALSRSDQRSRHVHTFAFPPWSWGSLLLEGASRLLGLISGVDVSVTGKVDQDV